MIELFFDLSWQPELSAIIVQFKQGGRIPLLNVSFTLKGLESS
jgi:hypothetical protein